MSNLMEVWSSVDIHPAAELFPMMSAEEYAGLVDDIHQHGQREKIVMWQGQLLDGRNRLKACIELDIEPEVIELPEDADPVAFICSLNVHRRHLSTSQRAMIAGMLADLENGKRPSQICECGLKREDAAKMMNVSARSVDTAKKVKEKAAADVVAKVKDGKMSLNAAAKTIDPPATYEVRRDPLEAIKKQIQSLEDGPADQLYRWMRHQQASAESDGYVIADGPPLAADDVDLLGQLCESDNAIGVVWHWLKNAGDAKSAVVREFCWSVIEDVDAPGAAD
jgi:hypothetical protein